MANFRTTLPIGATTVGPFSVGSATEAAFTIDRTVNGGLNSLTSASSLGIVIQSSENGTTWNDEAGPGTQAGGTLIVKGSQLNTWTFSVSGIDPNAIDVRLTATVGGPSQIVVAGTVTIT